MASRFGSSSLHQRDSRSDLFKGYTGGAASRTVSASPSRQQQQPQQFGNGGVGGYGYGGYQPGGGSGGSGPGGSVGASGSSHLGVAGGGGYRPATPNRNDAVLNELESQNDQQVDGILGKVRLLKDMTVAIGDEIRDSSALAEKMNDGFDQTRLRLGRTMNRMMVMAERTGVGWRVWLAFFAAVIFLFVYVWLF
ncbi:hypothetical protein CHGG_10376 [Chaetomium globosum CBS 148.51]|uniref:t-SNARE coiled-coil homology domain-containing protein n=1 Tax=Chaetomium globosum (strain ATCC 6205 / CBS 148.51 / DSM 1962 / NBRC 6347 / NRRL 1970) TaxID=306901 RepID=Q2GNS8_CHAGB|nr:uncharacterized protein CHGG_10376 [Chaetomium globosum CBS 148.51]EAQ83972.1 hypothetical protein CHGG_10376 [Chaetomium globosum CBS 148.51]